MRFRYVLFVALLAFSIPALAGDDSSPNAAAGPCSLAGTWYGGSDPSYPYLMTITPIAGNRFTVHGEAGADNLPYGYNAWTGWQGEVARDTGGTYHFWAVSYWVWNHDMAVEAGVDDSLPEMDIVHSTFEFTDCNTMTSAIDTYAAYFTFGDDERTPFIDAPDLDWLGTMQLTTLVETYHRLPRLSEIQTQKQPRLPDALIGGKALLRFSHRR